MRILAALVLAPLLCAAAEYPRPTGYVNDFANQLAQADREALENKLRAYEHDSSNQVVVAIVPSLEGESIERYANDLFHAWGIGKKGKDNGVLFLWAVQDRKVRTEVGYGLESKISEAAAHEINAQATAHFRQGEFPEGVNAAVDAIIERLGSGAGRRPSVLPPAIGTALIATLVFALARRRKRKLMQQLPAQLDRTTAALEQAESQWGVVRSDLSALKAEAPEAVWRPLADLYDASGPQLGQERQELDALRQRRPERLRELAAVSRQLRHLEYKLSTTGETFTRIHDTLQSFRTAKLESQKLLETLPAALRDMSARGEDRLLAAAQETFEKAQDEAAKQPANWLLVYDLLQDAQDCLARIDDPTRGSRMSRYWPGSETYSPAADLLAALLLAQASSRANDSWTSGPPSDSGPSDSGGSDFGGFGGGDSGGGGGSDSY
jgi:uncharacterized membrane protein YgcG